MDPEKCRAFAAHFLFSGSASKMPQIIALQDTQSHKSDSLYFASQLYSNVLFAHPEWEGRPPGVLLAFRNTLSHTILGSRADPKGWYIVAHVEVEGEELVIVNVYLPAARELEETRTILQNISNAIEEFNSEHVVWCGDFNAVLDPNVDTNKKHRASNNVAVRNLLLESELTDVWRVMHPSTRRYSCVSRVSGTLSRLDYFFASPCFMTHVLDTTIGAAYRSDHAPLFLQFTLSENERGKCFWKMPDFLIHDTELHRQAAEDIKTLLLCNEDSPLVFCGTP